MKKLKEFIPIVILTLTLILTPINVSHAVETSEMGYIAGSGFTSLIYTPIKGAFALLLGVTGGLSLMATVPANKSDISIELVNLGFGGDWWVSPDHLRGKRDLKFSGSS
ncbi:MAG: hypothetical protein V3V31_08040 [Methylococcales bacterium]